MTRIYLPLIPYPLYLIPAFLVTTFRPIPEEEYISNPGYLKLDLMLRGARVDESFYKKKVLRPEYRLTEHVYGNLDLILPKETHASIPFQEDFVKKSPYKLRNIRGQNYLTYKSGGMAPVKVLDQPDCYAKKVNRQVKIQGIAECHGSYVSLSLGGHRYMQPHLLGDAKKGFREDFVLNVEEVIGLLECIRKEQPIDVVTLSSWSTEGEDGGILQIEPYIRAIKSSFNVLLFVEIHLPEKSSWIDRTYAMGADSVCYHIGDLCSHGPDEKVKRMKVEEELRLLKHAVSIFSSRFHFISLDDGFARIR